MMKQVENILIWKWKQPNARFVFNSEHVNAFADKIRENTTLDVTVSCVTDDPVGLDPSVNYIPLPDFGSNVSTQTWKESEGLPQCYRRLIMWSPDAEKLFGKRYMSIDLDTIITGNIDHLLTRQEAVLIFRGTNSRSRPYNGGLVIMDAGARPEVFTTFTPEGAIKSGKMFVGSDQAWLSYVLSNFDSVQGKHVATEVTIGEEEGVTHYSHNLVTKNGGWRNFSPPEGTCIIFFPGNFKIFYNGDTMGGADYEKKCIRKLMGLPEKYIDKSELKPNDFIYSYNDPKQWGKSFLSKCMDQKIHCKLVNRPNEVPDNAKCFVRVDQQSFQRHVSKNFVKDLHKRGCKTLPTAFEAELYDDKVEQFKVLGQYMPDTWLFENEKEAIEFANTREIWPIYSKAADGAGSATVRKLIDKESAIKEVKQVFSTGITSAYDRKQKGYVLWQEYIPNTPCTYRFNVIGDYIMGFRREHDQDGLPIPGQNPAMSFVTEFEQEFAKAALTVNDHIESKWMCYDFLFDERGGEFKLLEISSAWPTKPWFTVGQMFTRDFKSTKHTGADMFLIATEILKSI